MQRPRIVRSDGAGARLPANQPSPETTSLRSVESPNAPVDAPELWAGVHIQDSGSSLERLAAKAQRFTPRVSVVPPDGLLLEVKGSLHLFNGIEGLVRELLSECDSVGVEPAIALAP